MNLDLVKRHAPLAIQVALILGFACWFELDPDTQANRAKRRASAEKEAGSSTIPEWHPAQPKRESLPPTFVDGPPGDLGNRYCQHLEEIGCRQRSVCPSTVRQRAKDHLHPMYEEQVLAAKTPAEALATGVVSCSP